MGADEAAWFDEASRADEIFIVGKMKIEGLAGG